MLQYIEILIIAVVQGIGEFLPISSSGHLNVTNELFTRFGEPLTGSAADFIKLEVLLHVGTLLAVLYVFRNRIIAMLGKEKRLIPLLITGTIPAVIVGLAIKKLAPWIAEDLYITGFCFFVTAALLLSQIRGTQGEKTCGTMTYGDAVFIGLFQAVAVLPGLSRSGSTIVAGLFRKLNREEAAVFSFLLSIPVIAGGGVLELKDLFSEEAQSSEAALSIPLLMLGMAVSCVVGIFALLLLMKWLKQGQLWHFAVWLLLIAPLTLVLACTHPATPPDLAADSNPPSSLSKTFLTANSNLSSYDPLTKAIEETPSSDRLNMSSEEAQKEYEKIVAEEEALEKAAAEEEKKRIPFVDEPEKLIKIDPEDPIWITPDKKSVVALGRIALREGLLELFACRVGTKEHESIVSMRVKPQILHAALLAIGAEAGKPVQVTPKFVPPSGDEILIKIRWKDNNGELKEVSAQDWVLDEGAAKKSGKNTAMKSNWVFSGSMIYKDDEGKNHYVADETGELFGLSNFVGAILDVPFESSADNDDLLFTCFTERIPELHTPVTLILTPVKKQE